MYLIKPLSNIAPHLLLIYNWTVNTGHYVGLTWGKSLTVHGHNHSAIIILSPFVKTAVI